MKKISEKVLNILVIVISLVCTIFMIVCSIFLAVKSDKKADVNIISAPVRTADTSLVPDFSVRLPFYYYVNFLPLPTRPDLSVFEAGITYTSLTFSRRSSIFSMTVSTSDLTKNPVDSEIVTTDFTPFNTNSYGVPLLENFYTSFSDLVLLKYYSVPLYYTFNIDNVKNIYVASAPAIRAFTSPVTGKTYTDIPTVNESTVMRELLGVSFFYSKIIVDNIGLQSDLNIPFYLFEFSEDVSFCLMIYPVLDSLYYLSSYSGRLSYLSPYYVSTSNAFDGTGGYQAGYQLGYQAGLSSGQDGAYSRGYAQGYKDAGTVSETGNFLTLFTTIADSQLVLLKGFLDFEFLGFNMLTFFKGLMTVLICIMVVRLITSGSTSS